MLALLLAGCFRARTPLVEPDPAVVEAVAALDPTEVVLFFPADEPAGDVAEGYFRALAGKAPQLSVVRVDQAMAWDLAESLNVRENGEIALRRGEAHVSVHIGDGPMAGRRLAKLDTNLLDKLDVLRRRTWPTSIVELGSPGMTTPLRAALKQLQEELSESPWPAGPLPNRGLLVVLSHADGSVTAEHAATYGDWVARGGRTLLLVEKADDPLATAVGLRVDGAPLVHPTTHAVLTRTDYDLAILPTSDYRAHPVTRRLLERDAPLVFVTATPLTVSAESDWKAAPLVGCTPGAFLDRNADWKRDPEEPEAGPDCATAWAVESVGGGRAVVAGDPELFGELLEQNPPNVFFLLGAIGWLAEEPEELVVPAAVESTARIAIVKVDREVPLTPDGAKPTRVRLASADKTIVLEQRPDAAGGSAWCTIGEGAGFPLASDRWDAHTHLVAERALETDGADPHFGFDGATTLQLDGPGWTRTYEVGSEPFGGKSRYLRGDGHVLLVSRFAIDDLTDPRRWAETALQPFDWADLRSIRVDADGNTATVTPGQPSWSYLRRVAQLRADDVVEDLPPGTEPNAVLDFSDGARTWRVALFRHDDVIYAHSAWMRATVKLGPAGREALANALVAAEEGR